MKALIFGLFLGGVSIWLPLSAIDPMARLIVPAVALLATSIFPCMSLAVGALKAEQRAPSQVDELYVQLHTIMKVLVVTFALAVATVACIVGLSGLTSVPKASPFAVPAGYAARVILAVVCVALALLGSRVVAIGKAFFAILDINRKHALLVARSKVQTDRDKAIDTARKQNFASDNKDPRELERA